MDTSKQMAQIAYKALDEKKGENIKIIDIKNITTIADYFVIANGVNPSQVEALVDNVEEKLHKAGYPLRQREGRNSDSWVLLDFNEIIVHVFDRENRLFYDLERIWRDGKSVNTEEFLKEE